ncbi:MAG: hypothetical protein LBK99_00780 [Opitutaceae bacterium]|jgi:hypothetical protein|nr:hypothetical protein [Opitutaceae bacterium]
MPTPWITITPAMLDTAKAAAFVSALGTAALGEDQQNPLPEIIASVTDRIRMEIAAGGRTTLSATRSKIPPSLKSLALRFIIREGLQRINIMDALKPSEDDGEAIRQDIRFLERIARGEITVEAPDDPEPAPTVQATVTVPLISARPRHFTRHQQDGV